ncbi:MAG: CDC48 family AAA ATPase [Nanoarchaeota archaeon]|nr:CDC48 family AAA ATPase [Nanoarchaeota archaeon]MBU1102988.1 CDC48 family AAA ATPase [Nanoarchaeota archaeon]
MVKNNNEIRLEVVESLQDDVYKGIVRIDPQLMRDMGLIRGDVILIKGGRETLAIVDRAYPADVGENIIRIDGLIRKNAKVGVGEQVIVRKANAKPASRVVIAPAQKGIMVQGNPEMLKNGLLGRPVIKNDIISLGGVQRRRDIMSEGFPDIFGDLQDLFHQGMPGGFQQIRFVVVSTSPNQPCFISEETEVVLNPKAVDISESEMPNIAYEDVGGMQEEIKKVREMVELPLKHPEIFEKLGIDAPKGVLLHGPPGTGKTLLAKAVANETEANFILLNGPEIMSKFYGESEKKIRDIFEDAEKNAPSIIFFDEIDAIAPKREDVQGEVERRVVSQLLSMMDGLKSRGKVIVIGATNRPNAIDPALRRPGRFDREVEISVPNKKGRLDILKIHTRNMPLAKNVNLEELSAKTHGFVGADLSALTKEAAMHLLRKMLPALKLEEDEPIPKEVLDKAIISQEDFEESLKIVRPSAMREVFVEAPNISWSDIGGMESTKQELKEAVEWPINNPEAFERLGIRAPRGILLYGPPGTGKTMLAKAVAKESEANFIQVKGPSLLSMWVGKSEEGVRKVFERARQVAPCVIFFDEIDSLAGTRGVESGTRVTERVLNQLLAEIDGLESLKDVTIIGATNRPDMLDPALLRPGRFDRIILADVPDDESRKKIFEVHTKNTPLAKDVSLSELVKQSEGFVGADIESLVREAALNALRENPKAEIVTKKNFEDALKKTKPSVSHDTAQRYKKIEEYYLKKAKAGLEVGPLYTG